jgi:predicted RNA-binding protein with PIN domain
MADSISNDEYCGVCGNGVLHGYKIICADCKAKETSQMAEAKSNLVDRIIDYENGELENDAVVILFQELIDSGMVWSLQGSYGRTAMQLIEAGVCHKVS